MATNLVPKFYDGTSLYKVVKIGEKKYCDHKVFGLVDGRWFKEHGVNPSEQQIPTQISVDIKKGEYLEIGEDYKKGERIEMQRNRNPNFKKDEEAMNSLVKEAHELFN